MTSNPAATRVGRSQAAEELFVWLWSVLHLLIVNVSLSDK